MRNWKFAGRMYKKKNSSFELLKFWGNFTLVLWVKFFYYIEDLEASSALEFVLWMFKCRKFSIERKCIKFSEKFIES